MRYIDWSRAKSAVPLLFVLALILDMFILRVTDQSATALELVLWTGVAVVSTFSVLFALYLLWMVLSSAGRAGKRPRNENSSQ